ncbi:hypothetical protein [Streptomyces sp. DSM 40907]|uniref:hypothetical protein n=1 Tax=Streptomyces kutzneri TaxID=3051179 RepID=UPI0028D5AAD2|nr:hypothetical protein [Streptomyces sp. DSM 40907]
MDPAEPTSPLAGELASLIARTRQAFARNLALRVAVPGGGQVRFVKQLTPAVDDLTGHGYQAGPGTGEYPIDVPDGESCDYHLLLDLPPGRRDGEVVAAELSIVALPPSDDGQILARLMTDRYSPGFRCRSGGTPSPPRSRSQGFRDPGAASRRECGGQPAGAPPGRSGAAAGYGCEGNRIFRSSDL